LTAIWANLADRIGLVGSNGHEAFAEALGEERHYRVELRGDSGDLHQLLGRREPLLNGRLGLHGGKRDDDGD